MNVELTNVEGEYFVIRNSPFVSSTFLLRHIDILTPADIDGLPAAVDNAMFDMSTSNVECRIANVEFRMSKGEGQTQAVANTS